LALAKVIILSGTVDLAVIPAPIPPSVIGPAGKVP